MARMFDAAAAGRNREPILAVLRRTLPDRGLVLEVASGTGQHAAYFAPRLAPLAWQPTEADPAMFDSIRAWSARAAAEFGPAAAPLAPLLLDAADPSWPVARADAVVCINMIHIAPIAACHGLLAGAARVLPAGGVLALYGPFRQGEAPLAPGNAAFDAELRRADARWGLRDLEDVAGWAARRGLDLAETVAMPANNLSVIFRRRAGAA